MMRAPHVKLLAAVVVLPLAFIGMAPAQTGTADPAVRKVFEKLVAAIRINDRTAFLADASDSLKQAITPKVMDGLNERLSSRMKKGYEASYLCVLRQEGYQVHLWKLAFKDGGDDLIVRIALKDSKVGGFFLQ